MYSVCETYYVVGQAYRIHLNIRDPGRIGSESYHAKRSGLRTHDWCAYCSTFEVNRQRLALRLRQDLGIQALPRKDSIRRLTLTTLMQGSREYGIQIPDRRVSYQSILHPYVPNT